MYGASECGIYTNERRLAKVEDEKSMLGVLL